MQPQIHVPNNWRLYIGTLSQQGAQKVFDDLGIPPERRAAIESAAHYEPNTDDPETAYLIDLCRRARGYDVADFEANKLSH